jgi:cytosine/uracil/thiamine/allantoin permease
MRRAGDSSTIFPIAARFPISHFALGLKAADELICTAISDLASAITLYVNANAGTEHGHPSIYDIRTSFQNCIAAACLGRHGALAKSRPERDKRQI